MEFEEKKQLLSKTLDIESKRHRIKEIERLMIQSSFWQDHQQAGKLTRELKTLSDLVTRFDNCQDWKELESLAQEFQYQGPYDENGAFLSIHAGSGGTEAQDWAQMLMRMYLRYGENENLNPVVIEQVSAEEAGIKALLSNLKLIAPTASSKERTEFIAWLELVLLMPTKPVTLPLP